MSRLNRKLNLSVLSQEETDQIREGYLSNSMDGMKKSIRDLNVETNVSRPEVATPEVAPRYEGTDLADVAREVYRENINPKAVKAEYQDEGPDTHARRVDKRSVQRALMGLRNGGDEGKTSLVGPNGSGNVGKYSPSADSGSGNATNNSDNYYALTTDMTLEEYQAHIDGKLNEALGTLAGIAGGALLSNVAGGAAGAALPTSKGILGLLGGKAAGVGAGKAVGTVGGAVGGGMIGNQVDKKKEEVKEDAIKDLKVELMQLEDTSWQEIDKVMRQIAKDNFMTPKELHKEFKAQHDGMIPDEWIKEHREVEMAGFIPLQELAQINPAGRIYTVSYMYRGGTQRRKFLVPHMNPPTKEEMQQYVQGFWPFARVLTYYPDPIDNEQNSNVMIAVPPVTENYKFYAEEDWVTLSEEDVEIYNTICEEEGEPITTPEQQADGTYLIAVADHDTGDTKYISFGEEKKEKKEKKDKSHRGKHNYLYNREDEETDQIDNESEASGGAEGGMSEAMSADEWNEKLKAAAAANQKRDKERGMKIHDTEGVKDMFKIGSKKKEVKEAAPFIAAGLGKAAGALTGKGIAKATAGQAAKGGLRKKASDYATRKGADMAQKKITDHLTDKEEVNEESDKKGKGSGSKDACYHKVKSRYSVWPSAYASGALVKCRQKGAKNWGNSDKKD
jgi:hypothetical protein